MVENELAGRIMDAGVATSASSFGNRNEAKWRFVALDISGWFLLQSNQNCIKIHTYDINLNTKAIRG